MEVSSSIGSVPKEPKKKRVFQRRLHEQLSESRMLKVLDQALQNTGPNNQDPEISNNEQENDDEDEEELVCVSKMVEMLDLQPTPEYQAGGVLKTVRSIHRQRAVHENQADH